MHTKNTEAIDNVTYNNQKFPLSNVLFHTLFEEMRDQAYVTTHVHAAADGHTVKRQGLLLSGNSHVRSTLVLVARLTEKFLGTSGKDTHKNKTESLPIKYVIQITVSSAVLLQTCKNERRVSRICYWGEEHMTVRRMGRG